MDGYEIVPYRSEFFEQVANVMIDLWGKDVEHNKAYLKWKYHNNPYTRNPLGIVALHNNKVVGFRGYFAERWRIKYKEFNILVAGDTCVVKEHRKKGISVAMGNKALDEYASKYKAFLNFSGTVASKRGYEKLGFVPLADKYKLERYAHRDDPNALFPPGQYISAGQFGNVIVSEKPKVQEMHDLVSKEYNDDVFSLVQNRDIFEWRFKNKKNKYIFCYHIKNNIITDYVVFGTQSKNFRSGRILDYTENNIDGLKKIIEFAVNKKFFEKLVIGNFGLSKIVAEFLHDLGFKPNTEYHREIIPLWVRASKMDFTEEDWFIKGLDIRKIENWKMKGVCSEWL